MKRVIFIFMILSLIFLMGCQQKEEAVFCTQDAKECPDGSFVGRVPPSCEFAECPTIEENDGLDEALRELDEIDGI